LPKAARDETLIQTLESQVAALSGSLLEAGLTTGNFEAARRYGAGYPTETQLVRFHCGCSFDRVLGALKMLEAELQDMIEKMMVLRRPAILWKSLPSK